MVVHTKTFDRSTIVAKGRKVNEPRTSLRTPELKAVPQEARAFILFIFACWDDLVDETIPPDELLDRVAEFIKLDVAGEKELKKVVEGYLKEHGFRKWWGDDE